MLLVTNKKKSIIITISHYSLPLKTAIGHIEQFSFNWLKLLN